MTVFHSLLLPIVAYGAVDLLGTFGCIPDLFSLPAERLTILVLFSAICRGSAIIPGIGSANE